MKIATFLFIFCVLPVIAAASLYTCRDSEGRLHVSDNLHTLQGVCQIGARKIEAKDPDNLHYVPERTSPPVVDTQSRYEHEVREEQRRQREQQQREAEMVERAREISAQFQRAQTERRNAITRWSTESRRRIEQAVAEMSAARNSKQRLIAEMEQQRVSSKTAEEVHSILDQVIDP